MALPRAVQEAADRAEAIQRKMAEARNTAQEATPVAKAAPVEEAPPAQPAIQEAQKAAEPVAQPKAEDPWEVKYRVLAGKYSAEVPRLAEQLREANANSANLESEIARLKEDVERLTKQASSPKLDHSEVVEKFGEEFVSAVDAVVTKVANQRAEQLRDEIVPQVKRAEDTARRAARQEFLMSLANAVPDYKEIDVDDRFTAYLDEVDPLTGRARRHFFNEADAANDALRVAQFFLNFKGANPSTVAPPKGGGTPPELLAPSVSRAGPLPTGGRKIWRRAEIKGFYEQARRGVYSSDEYRRIESDIFAAQREGRIAA